MDIADVCLATFATVAGVISGAFGFLVAVVLYRIQSLSDKTIPALSEKYDRLYAFVLSQYESGTGAQHLSKLIVAKHDREAEETNLKEIKQGLIVALNWTIGTVVGSLVALSQTPVIVLGGYWTAEPMLLLAVGAAAWTISLYAKLIRQVAA